MPFVKMESSFLPSPSPTRSTSASTSSPTSPPTATTVMIINDLILRVKLNYPYKEIRDFYNELSTPNEDKAIGNPTLSILQLYALHALNTPVDMSNQSVRTVYRPILNIHRNDEFSPFKHNFLLNLLDIEYTIDGENGGQFPVLWKTTFDTNVTVRLIESNSTDNCQTTSAANVNKYNSPTTLLDLFKTICREQKYDESHATLWEHSFKAEHINTLNHLRSVTKSSWEKLSRVPEVVKQLIKNYIEMNVDTAVSGLNPRASDPYQHSKATLFADIHRVRRYFYYAIQKLHLLAYLSRQAVTLAIEEVKKTYDDDGNILINIQNYLNTFCLENRLEDVASYEQKKADWQRELDRLTQAELNNEDKVTKLKAEVQKAEEKWKQSEERRERVCHSTNEELLNKQIQTILQRRTMNERERQANIQEANRIRADHEQKRREADENARRDFNEYNEKKEEHWNLIAQIPSEKAQIEHLQSLIDMKFEEAEKKLMVKYGRGLLLYGPPGTGMSFL
ncbi:unnamed protein product [Adineta ricciae]|uniref:Uncharacterized protein n=1 Tax=Adineta ricciae TaxID=249248 RepID=A0A814XP33_ADIRI|nr:unnamed protein product [Adineta ricciae]CAF1217581.1 unnamed protein product [Adineta ricciae]